MNQSKVRLDHDPWHDVAVPLNPEPAVPEGEEAAGSRDGAHEHSHLCSGYQCKCCFEHEVVFHTFTSQKSDFVEISAIASGLTACIATHIHIYTHVPTNTFFAGMVETSIQESTNNGPMQHLPCDQCSHDPHAPSYVMPHAIWPLRKCKDNMIIYQKQVLENILCERILQEATRPTANGTGRAREAA